MTPLRYFKSINTLTIPHALQVGPGGVHDRAMPGDVLAFDAEKCRKEDRFIAGRVRAGDLVETDKATYDAFVASTTVPAASPLYDADAERALSENPHDESQTRSTTPAAKTAKGK